MTHLIIIAIFLLSSGAMSVLRWYAKKKVELDAERAERDREQAILRTGRDPRDPTAGLAGMARTQPQRPREEDLMAERQEALRQLRRQQTDRAETANPQPVQRNVPQMGGGGGGGSSGGPITRELWPGGPVIVINGPGGGGGGGTPAPAPRPVQRTQQELRRPPQPVPQQRQSMQQQRQPMPQQRQQPQQQKKAKPVQKRQQPQQQQRQQATSTLAQRNESRHDEAYYQRERSLARMQASNAVEETAAAAPVFVRPTTAQQWRAAFIAAEVFGAPVSMRDPSAPIGCPTR